jgi:hypothetical protein
MGSARSTRHLFAGRAGQVFPVETLENDGLRAVVAATLVPGNWLRRSEWENVVRYDLVGENGRWGIDDIHGVSEPKTWSFRQILTSYLH